MKQRSALLLFGLYSAIGLLLFASYYFDDLARAYSGTMLRRFLEEMTGVYTAFALYPGIVAVARRFPPSRSHIGPWCAVVASALAYGVAHTTLMAMTRAGMFPLVGLGRYDYGIMLFRYPMEAAKDVIAFAVIYGFTYVFGRIERGRQAELAAADLRTELARVQFENLRLQLHPHFLFNTLNAISAVMYEDVGRADIMIARLSDFLRVVLASEGVVEVDIAHELRVERMYLDIMTTRLERRLQLGVTVAADADAASIPFMLLQPLLENSIRHGMHPTVGDLRIGIDVSRRQDLTVIDLIDDGVGFAPGDRVGHGLHNVESRLRHLYGSRSSFTIGRGAAGGTHVRLAFPHSVAVPT